MVEILGNVICFGNLDVDNVDQLFEHLSTDVPLFYDASFILASEDHLARSPPSVQRTSFGGDRGMPEIGEFACRGVAPTSDLAAELGMGEVEPSAGGSDDHSSVEQHVPSNPASAPRSRVRRRLSHGSGFRESSTGPTPPRDINAEFIEPFWALASSFSIRLPTSLLTLRRLLFELSLSCFRESLVDGLSQILGPEDIDSLMDVCGCLEDAAKRVDAELIGFLELVQLLTTFRECWHFYLEMVVLSPLLEIVLGIKTWVDSLQ
ncbi:hypothetical protein ACLOJK_004447 [Asimina triloba]